MKSVFIKGGVTLLVTFMLLLGSINLALAWTLNGTVFGGDKALGNVQVSLTNTATLAQAAGSTDASGVYSFTSLPNGNYNLTLTPPTGSNFSVSVVSGIQVSGGDVTQNVLLLSPVILYTVSGTVRSADGKPVTAPERVDFFTAIDPDVQGYYSTTTDSDGYYTIAVPAGTYTLAVELDDSPRLMRVDRAVTNLSVLAGRTQDITWPALVTLSGKTIDSNGTPVPGITVAANSFFNGVGCNNATVSDASGNYSMAVLPYNAYLITVTPPAGNTTLGYQQFPSVSVLADTARNLTVPIRGQYTVSGTVHWPAGTAPAGTTYVTATTSAWGSSYRVEADSQGHYTMTMFGGVYSFGLEGAPNWGADFADYGSNAVVSNFSLAANSTLDLTWPTAFVTVSGKVKDSNGTPLPGAHINISGEDSTGFYSNSIMSDASGNYSVSLPPCDTYEFDVYPPEGYYTLLNQFIPVSVTATTARDLILPLVSSYHFLSGTVHWPVGASVPPNGAVVLAYDPANYMVSAGGIDIDSDGNYSLWLPSGVYNLAVAGYTPGPPDKINFHRTLVSNFSLTDDNNVDLSVPPFVTLSGKTTDSNGAPVPGAAVNLFQNSHTSPDYFTGSATSDASGNYSFPVLPNTDYSVTVIPPSGSGFLPATWQGMDIASDRSLAVIIDLPTAVPIIKVAPKPTYLSDKTATIFWQTDKPTKGSLSFGTGSEPGTTVNEAAYSTDHSIVLTGLTPRTKYYLSVSATDASGNGPATRSSAFTTTALPDPTPPAFTVLPRANAADATSATISWSTDRFTTGMVTYGLRGINGSVVNETNAGTVHSVKITGLTPLTQYYFTVAATDQSSNVNTISSSYDFTTPAAPDTTPPNIDGPMANSIGDKSVTIAWTTDEPATSGVSWNVNGTNYGVTQDPALVTVHSVTITGLTAGTSYNFTASSIDANGNGPTLKGGTFTTRSAPDTAAPVFTTPPVAASVSDTSAILSWTTDKGASCDVKYGSNAALLDQTDSSVPGLLTKQNRTIANLAVATTYYYQVVATDVNGRVQASTVGSFTTGTQPDNLPPIITAPATIAYASNKIAVVSFSTDKPCDATVRYGVTGTELTGQASDPSGKVTSHLVNLTNLIANTSYNVQVACTDANGLTVLALAGKPLTYFADSGTGGSSDASAPPAANLGFTTTALPDTTAPAITTAPAAPAITTAAALITWSTDKISDSQVFYGLPGQNTPLFAGDMVKVTGHAVTLTNLAPDTTYEFKVQSTDPSNNTIVSSVYSFTTAALADVTAPVISNLAAGGATISRIHVTWNTDEPATTLVKYGTSPTNLSAQAAISGLSTAHDVTLYNLVPGTTYYLAPVSADSSNNSSQGATRSVTLAGGAPVTHLVTATAGTGGSITPSSQSVNDGYKLTFSATPDTGYLLNSITGCGGTLVGNAYTTAAITADCQVSATFSADPNYSGGTALATRALPASGSYAGGTILQVQLLATRPNATIYYTTDGSTPTVSSKVYTAPISISGTATVKYFAKDSTSSEAVQSSSYSYAASADVVASFTGAKSGASFTVLRSEGGKSFGVVAANAASTTFTDSSALKPNTVYQYAVSSDSDPTQTVFMTIRTPMYRGWNIVAVPYQTTGIPAASFFASPVSTIYKWVPTGATSEASNTQLGSYQPVTTLDPGNGYFVKTSNGSTMLAYAGAAGPASATVTLKPGWTMIANPNSANKTEIANSWLIDGAPLSAAISANKVGGGIYWWNGTTYDSWSIIGDNPQVEPWKGYWLINLESIDHTLTIQ